MSAPIVEPPRQVPVVQPGQQYAAQQAQQLQYDQNGYPIDPRQNGHSQQQHVQNGYTAQQLQPQQAQPVQQVHHVQQVETVQQIQPTHPAQPAQQIHTVQQVDTVYPVQAGQAVQGQSPERKKFHQMSTKDEFNLLKQREIEQAQAQQAAAQQAQLAQQAQQAQQAQYAQQAQHDQYAQQAQHQRAESDSMSATSTLVNNSPATASPLQKRVDIPPQAGPQRVEIPPPSGPNPPPALEGRELAEAQRQKDAHLAKYRTDTIVPGLEDNELWVLLRTFNTQVNHVLHPARGLPPGQPDLRQTNLPNVPYRSDTLKANLERLISGLAPPSSRGLREIARLTDWHGEFERTLAYCSAYFLSWALGITVIAAFTFFAVLTAFPDTRRVLFPDLPTLKNPPPENDPQVITTTTKTAQGGTTTTTKTAAAHPKLSKAEMAEEHSVEVTAVALGYISKILFGSKGQEGNAVVGPKDLVPDYEHDDNIVTDKDGKILGYRTVEWDANATMVEIDDQLVPIRKDRVAKEAAKDEAEGRRDELTTWMAKSTETGIGGMADFVEIMQKALSPPPVYPDTYARYKLAALFIAPAILLHFVPAQVVGRMVTLGFGIVFWGHELLQDAWKRFVKLVPNWLEYIDPRNHILSGVPTNAQMTLYLLREGEDEGEPLPLPPTAPALEETSNALSGAKGEMRAAGAAVQYKDRDVAAQLSDKGVAPEQTQSHGVRSTVKKQGGKTKRLFKRAAAKIASMGGDVSVVGEDNNGGVKQKLNSMVLKAKWGDDIPEGGFIAKLNGTSGHLFLDEDEECLSWVPLLSKEAERVWYIDDLVEMKKQGLGVSRLALAMMSGAEIESLGLSLRFAKTADEVSMSEMTEEQQLAAAQRASESLDFKGVKGREELFNRLIAMGHQRWEML